MSGRNAWSRRLAWPMANASFSDSSTDAVEPPMIIKYLPWLTVPDLSMAMGAFFNNASVQKMPSAMLPNSITARVENFFTEQRSATLSGLGTMSIEFWDTGPLAVTETGQ